MTYGDTWISAAVALGGNVGEREAENVTSPGSALAVDAELRATGPCRLDQDRGEVGEALGSCLEPFDRESGRLAEPCDPGHVVRPWSEPGLLTTATPERLESSAARGRYT